MGYAQFLILILTFILVVKMNLTSALWTQEEMLQTAIMETDQDVNGIMRIVVPMWKPVVIVPSVPKTGTITRWWYGASDPQGNTQTWTGPEGLNGTGANCSPVHRGPPWPGGCPHPATLVKNCGVAGTWITAENLYTGVKQTSQVTSTDGTWEFSVGPQSQNAPFSIYAGATSGDTSGGFLTVTEDDIFVPRQTIYSAITLQEVKADSIKIRCVLPAGPVTRVYRITKSTVTLVSPL